MGLYQDSTTIKKIEPDDVTEVVRMVDRIAGENGQRMYKTNRDYCEKSLLDHLASPLFRGFYTENACFIGKINMSTTNPSVTIAEEWIWVSNGRDGLKVLRAFEEWAKEMGATLIHINTDFDVRTPKRILAMERRDYKVGQLSFTRWLI